VEEAEFGIAAQEEAKKNVDGRQKKKTNKISPMIRNIGPLFT